jgi:hypothetical protein
VREARWFVDPELGRRLPGYVDSWLAYFGVGAAPWIEATS